MPTKLCLEARCGEVATYRGRCPGHARTNDKSIQRAGRSIYATKRWQLLRRKVLFEQPLCPGVYGDTCGVLAEHVHHIKDIAQGGNPWAKANLVGLCASCHSRITRQEQAT